MSEVAEKWITRSGGTNKQQMTAREMALVILYRLEEGHLHADWLLSAALSGSRLGGQDKALVTELVNGVLRWRRRLDAVLDLLLVKKSALDLTPWIRNILRMGLYQIQYLDRIPPAAATHQAVSLAKRFGHRGTASLVNAVLRNAIRSGQQESQCPPLERDPVGHIGVRYSHPDWMIQRWLRRYGQEETIALCQANNRVPQVAIRINPLKTTEAQLRASLCGQGVEVIEGHLVPGFLRIRGAGDVARLKAFRQGWFQIQDESAGLAVLLLAPEPGEKVVDLCSAPGGKTAHMAALMGDRGMVLAVDRNARRLRDVKDNCRRLGISSPHPLVADGRSLQTRPVDRVLVDAPCSGLGVLARRADLRWRKREQDIPRLARLQLQLLAAGANLLKTGGVLVYSTCTIEDQENEEVVDLLLSQRDDLILERAAPVVFQDTVTERGFLRTFPHKHGLDGTFGARLRKVPGGGLR